MIRKRVPQRIRARAFVVAVVVLTFIFYLVPYGRSFVFPLVLLSVFVHEMGHGIAILLVGGRFDSLPLTDSGCGSVVLAGEVGQLALAFVSAGGLFGPPILGALLFVAVASEIRTRQTLNAVGIVSLLCCALVVTGWVGWFFVAGLGVICLYFGTRASVRVSQAALTFLATQMALSVFSGTGRLFDDFVMTDDGLRRPSDVALIAEGLFFPYWFWGALCGVFSLLVLWFGFRVFWRTAGGEEPSAPRARQPAVSPMGGRMRR